MRLTIGCGVARLLHAVILLVAGTRPPRAHAPRRASARARHSAGGTHCSLTRGAYGVWTLKKHPRRGQTPKAPLVLAKGMALGIEPASNDAQLHAPLAVGILALRRARVLVSRPA